MKLVIEAAERYARELLDQVSKYERRGMAAIAAETFNDHYMPLRAELAALTNGPLYVCGLLDEHEFMGQMPPHFGLTVRGPFLTPEAAQEVAKTMSTDPDEAVVVECIPELGS